MKYAGAGCCFSVWKLRWSSACRIVSARVSAAARSRTREDPCAATTHTRAATAARRNSFIYRWMIRQGVFSCETASMPRSVAIVLLGLVFSVGCGQPAAPPQQQIDTVGIRSELLAIAQAEGQYLVAHSTYGTFDELRQDNLLTGSTDRRGYAFVVAVDGSQAFTVTATPVDPDKKGWPTLAMDQTRQISEHP